MLTQRENDIDDSNRSWSWWYQTVFRNAVFRHNMCTVSISFWSESRLSVLFGHILVQPVWYRFFRSNLDSISISSENRNENTRSAANTADYATGKYQLHFNENCKNGRCYGSVKRTGNNSRKVKTITWKKCTKGTKRLVFKNIFSIKEVHKALLTGWEIVFP